MPNTIRTIWITSLALIAMLTISMFADAKVNIEPLLQHHSELMSESALPFAPHCSILDHDTPIDTNHHCCGSICLLKMPNYRAFSDLSPRIHSLALIPEDHNVKTILRAKTLYRPPIV